MSRADAVVWAAILAVGAGTYAMRASFLVVGDGPSGLGPGVERALRFVPPAVMAALVLPALLVVDGSVTLLGNDRLLAGLLAGAVAWRTEDILATIVVGVGALLALGLVG